MILSVKLACVGKIVFVCCYFCCGILLCLGYGIPAAAQNDLLFHELSAQNGLEDNKIVFTYTDSKNFTWIGTLGLLYRFDGKELLPYGPSKGVDAPYLQSSMFEDQRGNLWFCAFNKLFCYHRLKDTCLSFGGFEEKKGVESLEDYGLIHLDQQDHLWLTAGARVFQLHLEKTLDTKKLVFKEHPTGAYKIEGKKFHPILDAQQRLTGFVEYFLLDKGMRVWWRKDKQRFEAENYFNSAQKDSLQLEIFQIQPFGQKANQLLLSTAQKLWVFDMEHKKARLFFSAPPHLRLFNSIYTNSRFLLCSTSDGFYYLDTQNKHFFKAKERSARLNSSTIDRENLHELHLDRNSILWAFAYDEGIAYTDLKLIKTEYISLNFKPDSWEELPDGSFAFGSDTGFFILKNGQLQRLLYERVNQIQGDKTSQRYWILTESNIYIYDFQKRSLRKILKKDEFNWSFLQCSDGSYWVSSDKSIKKLDLANRQKISINASIDKIKGTRIIWEDQEHRRIYVHENTSTLRIYQYEQGEWFQHREMPLNGDIGQFLVPKGSDKIWVASITGIKLIHRTKGTIEDFDMPPSWPNFNLTSLVQDKKGTIWASTNTHILSFSAKGEPLQIFTLQDGFLASPFRSEGMKMLNNGQIGIIGRFGFNIFDTGILNQKSLLPQIQLTRLFIQGQPYSSFFPQDTSISEKKRIRIRYKQNSISLRLVGIELSQANNVKIQYFLEGWEKLGDASTRNQVAEPRYNKLSPGKYTLKVRAANAHGEWTGWKNQLRIEVIPPFWMQWWFIALASVVVILLIVGGVQWYYLAQLRVARIRNEEQERILRDIHDLTSGKVVFFQDFQQFATQEISDTAAQSKALGIAEQALLLFRRISAAVRNNNDADSTLMEFLHQLITESRKNVEGHLLFNAQFDSPIPYAWVAGEIKKQLRLVIQEALGNVVKHAEANAVVFKVNIVENKLMLQIQDNGKGIPKAQLDQIQITDRVQDSGNGLGNMLRRIESIGGSIKWLNHQGTQVSISISLKKIRPKPKSFVNFVNLLMLKKK